MFVEGKRPRELHWYHAGPMLFGDWGTSRLYVLGLAFYYTRHASLWFMLAMSVLLVAVGWAYRIICRLYPDGGGVYSSARHRSQTLAMIGGLLLCADYLVTAAISALDAFQYLNVERPALYALGSLVLLGVIGYFGPRKSGSLALVVALLTIVLTLTIGGFAVRGFGHARIEVPAGNPLHWWAQFTSLILAISGVEAIANMTGLMVQPVEKTATRSIVPVLCEIVILNLVLTVAMLAMPLDVLGGGDPAQAYTLHRDDMLRAIASYYVGPAFAAASAFVFAMLLLSASNTALTDLVSIQFMMARDRELPAPFGLLNAWGMPVIPLIVATIVPIGVLLVFSDVEQLADLYAIGVVGAVAINLGSCGTNPELDLKRFERWGMNAIALVMLLIWITIAYEKPHALIFALSTLAVGLVTRYVVRHRGEMRDWVLAEFGYRPAIPALSAQPVIETVHESQLASGLRVQPSAPEGPRPSRRIMVATRGSASLVHFALEQAQAANAELDIVFVRHLAVPVLGTPPTPDLDVDPAAKTFLGDIGEEAKNAGVPVRCIYVIARNVGKAIVNLASNCGVETLIIQSTRRSRLWRAVKGNVVRTVSRRLPKNIDLVIHQ